MMQANSSDRWRGGCGYHLYSLLSAVDEDNFEQVVLKGIGKDTSFAYAHRSEGVPVIGMAKANILLRERSWPGRRRVRAGCARTGSPF